MPFVKSGSILDGANVALFDHDNTHGGIQNNFETSNVLQVLAERSFRSSKSRHFVAAKEGDDNACLIAGRIFNFHVERDEVAEIEKYLKFLLYVEVTTPINEINRYYNAIFLDGQPAMN